MTVLVKIQIEIRFFIEFHGNSKLLKSCPPSSVPDFMQTATRFGSIVEHIFHPLKVRVLAIRKMESAMFTATFNLGTSVKL